MEAKMPNNNNRANQLNANRGTKGANTQYAQAMGNKGKQNNPIPNNANTAKGGRK